MKLPDLDCFIDVKGALSQATTPASMIPTRTTGHFYSYRLASVRSLSVIGWQWASDVKKPKWRDDRQRKPGEPVLYRRPPPHRPAVELINVLWQREMVE